VILLNMGVSGFLNAAALAAAGHPSV